jgi:import inner membrane translocase subunit TIM8
MASLESNELEKLSESDKNDLRKFLATEQQKTQIQSRTFTLTQGRATRKTLFSNADSCTETHMLTDMCWKKCVSGSIKSTKLDRTEEGCLTNCVDRFLDLGNLTIKHINSMRN